MAKPVQSVEGRKANASTAWRNWLLVFVLSFIVIFAASEWFGFNLILPLLAAMLVAALSYQRLINKRSWRAIMWGIHASTE